MENAPPGAANWVYLSSPTLQRYLGYIYLISVPSEAMRMSLSHIPPKRWTGIARFWADRRDPVGGFLGAYRPSFEA